MAISLGHVGHFSLAVSNVDRAARFWMRNFDLKEMFRFEDGIGLTNDNITIVFFKGNPRPEVIDHMSFHLKDMNELRAALQTLKENDVEIEDPGDEIGPESEGSKNMGLWFHDPDGYRWELSVQNGAGK